MTALPPYTPFLQRGFIRFLHRFFRKNFNGVRIARDGIPEVPVDRPVVVISNHPSWWDPITLLLMGELMFPGRRCYGPIDAEALTKYPILGRLGLLPLDSESPSSIRAFMRSAEAIFADNQALGMTVQGEFVDSRSRPLKLQAGIAHLMRRFPDVPVVPVALEYPFWNERRPEALIRFGEVDLGGPHRRSSRPAELLEHATGMLTDTMDCLSELAQTRDPAQFETLIDGRRGVGGSYDLLRRLKAWSQGRSFDPSHEARPGGSPQ
ncbi:MAG: lysophospholipid acyltransferase family protein [Xanthomonadales bacterium]|nr:lysophospholipid acyltransferase family protein [Xanthomonadales bacterium]